MIDSGDRNKSDSQGTPKVNNYVDKKRNQSIVHTAKEVVENVNAISPRRADKIGEWVKEWQKHKQISKKEEMRRRKLEEAEFQQVEVIDLNHITSGFQSGPLIEAEVTLLGKNTDLTENLK